MKEDWKDIKDYEGLYQVSNMGNVRSTDRYVNNNGGLEFRKGRLLKLSNNKGYIQVVLCKDGKTKTYKVHRLVAETFILNIDNKPFIDHINTDRTDNRVDNLRWVTKIENMNNPLTKERLSKSKSKPILQYDKNGNFIKEWNSALEVEKEIGLNHSNIGMCCNNKPKYKSVGGYIWRYKLCG